MTNTSSKWSKTVQAQIDNAIRENGEPLYITSDGVCQYEEFVCIPDEIMLKAIRGKIDSQAFIKRTFEEFKTWKEENCRLT